MGMFDSLYSTVNSGMAPIKRASSQAMSSASNAVNRGLGPSHPIIQLIKKAQSDGAYNLGLMGNQVADAVKYQAPGMIRDAASNVGSGIRDMASNARRNLPSIGRFW